jgi:hypothetical protein
MKTQSQVTPRGEVQLDIILTIYTCKTLNINYCILLQQHKAVGECAWIIQDGEHPQILYYIK